MARYYEWCSNYFSVCAHVPSIREYGFLLVTTTASHCASPISILNSSNARAKLIFGLSMSKIPNSQAWRAIPNPYLGRRAWYCRFLPLMYEARASRRAVVFINSRMSNEIIMADVKQLPHKVILLSTMMWCVLCHKC